MFLYCISLIDLTVSIEYIEVPVKRSPIILYIQSTPIVLCGDVKQFHRITITMNLDWQSLLMNCCQALRETNTKSSIIQSHPVQLIILIDEYKETSFLEGIIPPISGVGSIGVSRLLLK